MERTGILFRNTWGYNLCKYFDDDSNVTGVLQSSSHRHITYKCIAFNALALIGAQDSIALYARAARRQFKGFLFPQAFPQEERLSRAAAASFEKGLKWLLVSRSTVVLLERHYSYPRQIRWRGPPKGRAVAVLGGTR